MPTKTPVKKTKKNSHKTKSLQTSGLKPVKKTIKKTAKKVTWDEIQAGFKELEKSQEKIQKSQDEAWKAIRETQQAIKETHGNIFGLDNAKEEAWRAIRETQQAIKETQKNIFGFDNAKEEAWKAIRETQQAIKETHGNIFGLNKSKDEAWVAIKETQKNIGGLSNTLGSIVERILTPGLPEKFKKFGYNFNRIASYSYAAGVYAQIDGMLENGSQAIAVEVKTTLRQADIDDHLVRMEKIRKYADEHGDKRQFMGAMATFNTDENAKNYALKKGLFVIEPSGEDVKVTKPETEPKVW